MTPGFIKDYILEIVRSNVPAFNVKLIPNNLLPMGSLFKHKDRLNPLMTSKVVYKYTCPKCDFGSYIGATKRLLRVRIDSHIGVSYRTGCPISNPEFSNIRQHSKKCKIKVKHEDFTILGQVQNDFDLPILESLMIKQQVPHLNAQTSATPLSLA